jgi:RNA polymerase sigma-70 factor, ECF subfamily
VPWWEGVDVTDLGIGVRSDAPGTVLDAIGSELESYRRELTGFCYRMLGSAFEAEDATQETLVRAWKHADGFEGRSSVRTWLYRIATNVCIDQLRGRQRRERPIDLGPASTVATASLTERPEAAWVEPAPDGRLLPDTADPAELAVARDTVRLAFVAALQHLPPRQRAILVLREVLRWQASEVADLLDTSVASVNSALQRARATLGTADLAAGEPAEPLDQDQRALLDRYVDAFERYDLGRLVELLREDAVQSMPPYELWLQGRDEIAAWMAGPGAECRGSRLVPTVANGVPAFGQYRRSRTGVGHEPWSLQVLQIRGGTIDEITFFLDTERLFPLFELPPRLDP